MPAELISLNEQLLNLKIVYEYAVYSDMPYGDIKKTPNQIKEVERTIAGSRELLDLKDGLA
jgi:hypothetical protein